MLFKLDLSEKSYTQCKDLSQFDDRTITVQLFENGQPYLVDTKTIKLEAKNSNNNAVIQTAGITKKGNVITVELMKDITRVSGKVEMKIVLTENSKNISTFKFMLNVDSSVTESANILPSITVDVIELLQDKINQAILVKQETEHLIATGGAASKGDVIKLTEQLDSIESKKANDIEVRKKTVPITEFDISDTLKQQINGNAPIIQTVGDGVVTPLKTTFIKRGLNLFNKNIFVTGKYVGYLDGLLYDNVGYNATDYILIEPNTQYSLINILGVHYAFYDSNKNYITRTTNTEQARFTTPANARYFRGSFQPAKLDTAMMLQGDFTSYPYIPYEEFLDDKYIKKVEDKVGFDKLSFTETTNLFNKNASDVLVGSFVDSGWVTTNATYSASGYIEVTPNTQYSISNFRFLDFYNESKTFISKATDFGDKKTFTTPVNTKYIRFSSLNTYFTNTMLNLGSTLLNYTDYKVAIPRKYLDIDTNEPLAFLPRNVYVAVGRTIELYNNQVCINADKFRLCWKCDVGSALGRKFTVTGKTEQLGSYDLILEIYNDSLKLLKTLTAKINIVNNVITNSVNILPIGDSLTNGKSWLTETNSLSGGKINYVGTRWNGFGSSLANATQKHEGRSGATAEWYIKNWIYDFDVNGVTPNNPFWNPATSKFDYAYYKSTYSINPNAIQLFLGTNGISVDSRKNVDNIKTIIDGIRLVDSNIKIYVCNTIYRSNQDGIGSMTNSQGYATFKNQYKFEEDIKVLNLMKAIDVALSGYPNVYFINLGLTHDSEFNFGQVEKTVNPRSTIKYYVPYDSVHPNNEGYLQMADVMYSTFCGTLN